MRKLVTLAAIAALVLLATSAFAQTYHWSYEGDVVPAGASKGSNSGQNFPSESTDGNILTIDFLGAPTGPGEPGTWDVAWWGKLYSDALMNTVDTWTVDWRMARPVTATSWGNTPNTPDYLSLYVAGQGTGGRLDIILGRTGYGGLGGRREGETERYDDSSTMTIYQGGVGYQEVVVPGLNAGVLNEYRLVGTGGGNYKLYVNGITTPVFTGTLTQNIASAYLTIGAQFSAAEWGTDMDMLVDFIRVNNNTAYDEPPVKAGIDGSITLQNYPDNAGKLALSPVRIELMQGTIVLDTKILTLSTNPGPYMFEGLAPGTYKLRFSAGMCVQKEVADIVVVDGVRTPVSVTLLNGDMDGDNDVTSTDLSAVLQNAGAIGQ